jgi:hypothetical protein
MCRLWDSCSRVMVDDMRDTVADRVGGSVPVLLTPYGGAEALFRLGLRPVSLD